LPFKDRTVSHLVLVDVFHHLQAPDAFLREARRVLVDEGRLILLEPYVSWFSLPVYGLMHHEPVAWRDAISFAERPPDPHDYYAAQGNTTRLFFRRVRPGWPDGWSVFHAEALAGVSYLLSGGFSRRALYPARWLPWLQRCDARLSRWPRAFGARCLIGLRPEGCRRRATPGVTARS
jgi:SAM-dependent methyltransferase